MFEHASTTLEILTIVVLGAFSFIALFDRNRRATNKDTIENLKETINSMKLRMEEMDKELAEGKRAHQESLEKIAHMRGENETLKSLLLGKDPESVEYKRKTVELLQEMIAELKVHDAFVKKAHPEVAV